MSMELNCEVGPRHYIDATVGTTIRCNRDIYRKFVENGLKRIRFYERDVFGLNAIFNSVDGRIVEEPVSNLILEDGELKVCGHENYGVILEDGSYHGFHADVSPWIYYELCNVINEGMFLDDEK